MKTTIRTKVGIAPQLLEGLLPEMISALGEGNSVRLYICHVCGEMKFSPSRL